MNSTLAGWLQVALVVAALAACYVPLGNWIARIFTTDKHWRVERGVYKVIGVNPETDQKWSAYLRSMLAFSGVSVLFLYGLERLQHYLLSFAGPNMANVPPETAWNTAASFVTNTNWQNYSGESTMNYLTQMAGLAVQNFMSAAVGIVVAIAMIRGFTRSRTDKLGNFWVDLTRCVFRLLLPLAVIAAIVFMAGGVVDNFANYHTITTLSGGHQTVVGGPFASQEAIKDLGNNGGGLVQRQLRTPLREPEPVHRLVHDLHPPGHPVRHAAGVRQDGQGQPAGLRARRGHGGHLADGCRRHQPVRDHAHRVDPGNRRRARPRRHGRQRGQVRHARRPHCSRRRPRSPRPAR